MYRLCEYRESGTDCCTADEVTLRIAAIVLAAGASRRMGRNKLLLEVEGETVLDRLLQALIPDVAEIVVVTGYNQKPVEDIAAKYHVRTVLTLSMRKE